MEHGKNRFFNICEAYQSMIGKSDSIGIDARRYNAINESYDDSPEEEWNLLTSPSNGLSVEVGGVSSPSAQKFESARERNRRGRTIGESYSSARIIGNRRPESNRSLDEIDIDDKPDEMDDLSDQILKVKELLGWNPVGGVSIVSGSFKPKYDHSYKGPFEPMSLDDFIKSATLCCTAEAHDVVNAETITVGGEAYLADNDSFENLVKDPYLAADYPEYALDNVVLSFDGRGTLTLIRLLHDSYTGHVPCFFRDVQGRDYVLSKILSSYPFLRDYVDNSDRKYIEFSLPPSMAMAIQGAADKRSQRYPTIKDEEDEERNYYGTYDSETGRYDSKYNIDVKNAYKDRFGGGKDYVG